MSDWRTLLDLSGLEELVFHNKLDPDHDIMARLSGHPKLRSFRWDAPDEAQNKVAAITRIINRPKPRPLRPEKWFAGER